MKFGDFARKVRLSKKIGLRQAARKMGVSPAYLSQVERNVDPPSLRLLAAMSQLYDRSEEELRRMADRAPVESRENRETPRSFEQLRALYRMDAMFTPAEVEDMIRHFLKKRGMTEAEIERDLARLRAELPRLHKSGREGLFAADIKPRFLSKHAIAKIAYRILEKNGIGEGNYKPPTPVELLVEEEGLAYVIDVLPSKDGDPIVLGRTRWNDGRAEVTINADLAASDRECDGCRFRFTLCHEFFHAIEHLPLAESNAGQLARTAVESVSFIDRAANRFRSRAERAVERWATREKAHGLSTREDWREWQANAFAAALLMPEWAVKHYFNLRLGAESTPSYENKNCRETALEIAGERVFGTKIYSKSLAQKFEVSRQAMAIRLLDLSLVQEVGSH
jgi:transcriptional regulator with XRE-family HTH domain/Zn-dependent peptidase ImmA (M78 family)